MLKNICLKKGVFYFLAGSEQSVSRTENQKEMKGTVIFGFKKKRHRFWK
jgi:hypothetical protein